jgi:hypothetical protein
MLPSLGLNGQAITQTPKRFGKSQTGFSRHDKLSE